MEPAWQWISYSKVACPSHPIGVIQFYGGEFFGSFPATFYDYLLERLYNQNYAVIATPFEPGLNHARIAEGLLVERDRVWAKMRFDHDRHPHIWLGHSIGCKFISLLEAYTDPRTHQFAPPDGLFYGADRRGIIDEPQLLMAPDIADTADAIRAPILPGILDRLGWGARPTRAQTQELIKQDDLFGLMAILSFAGDTIAGNQHDDPNHFDVPWFLQFLEARGSKLHREVPGSHLAPLGVRLGDIVVEADLRQPCVPAEPPPATEQALLDLLRELTDKRQRARAARKK